MCLCGVSVIKDKKSPKHEEHITLKIPRQARPKGAAFYVSVWSKPEAGRLAFLVLMLTTGLPPCWVLG